MGRPRKVIDLTKTCPYCLKSSVEAIYKTYQEDGEWVREFQHHRCNHCAHTWTADPSDDHVAEYACPLCGIYHHRDWGWRNNADGTPFYYDTDKDPDDRYQTFEPFCQVCDHWTYDKATAKEKHEWKNKMAEELALKQAAALKQYKDEEEEGDSAFIAEVANADESEPANTALVLRDNRDYPPDNLAKKPTIPRHQFLMDRIKHNAKRLDSIEEFAKQVEGISNKIRKAIGRDITEYAKLRGIGKRAAIKANHLKQATGYKCCQIWEKYKDWDDDDLPATRDEALKPTRKNADRKEKPPKTKPETKPEIIQVQQPITEAQLNAAKALVKLCDWDKAHVIRVVETYMANAPAKKVSK